MTLIQACGIIFISSIIASMIFAGLIAVGTITLSPVMMFLTLVLLLIGFNVSFRFFMYVVEKNEHDKLN